MIAVDITVRLVVDADEMTPEVQSALENLAAVMGVQAEDGLYPLGSPESYMDGTPNDHLADIAYTRTEVGPARPVSWVPAAGYVIDTSGEAV